MDKKVICNGKMVKVDFRVFERFEGFRGQGFGVIVQRRKLTNAYVSSLFRIMLAEVFEVMFDVEAWGNALTEAGMQRVKEAFQGNGKEWDLYEPAD